MIRLRLCAVFMLVLIVVFCLLNCFLLSSIMPMAADYRQLAYKVSAFASVYICFMYALALIFLNPVHVLWRQQLRYMMIICLITLAIINLYTCTLFRRKFDVNSPLADATKLEDLFTEDDSTYISFLFIICVIAAILHILVAIVLGILCCLKFRHDRLRVYAE